VDRLVCNPPFGRKLGRPEEMQSLYQGLLLQFQRVLRTGAIAVLLVSDIAALTNAAGEVGWRLVRRLRIRVLGQQAFLTVWQHR